MPPHRQPTDTLYVTVTELRYPVTEQVLRDAFSAVAPVGRVQMLPQQVSGAVSALVSFADASSASRALSQRSGRHIYAECNRMQIEYAPSASQPEPAPLFAAPPQSLLPPPQAMQVAAAGLPPQAHYQAQVQQQAAQQQAMQAQVIQQQQQQILALQQQMLAAQQQQQMQPQGMMQPGGMGMGVSIGVGGRGGGMMPNGGPGGAGFSPYGAGGMMGGGGRGGGMMGGGRGGGGMMGGPMGGMMGGGRGGAMMGGPMGMGGMQGGMMMGPGGVQPFVSINEVPAEATLQDIFNLLEIYGAVATIRRTSKPGIVHVKMFGIEDAEAIARCIHKFPFMGAEISARTMPTFVEKTEAPLTGDPTDVTCTYFNFHSSRHRPRALRCRWPPTTTIRLHIKREARTVDEAREYFTNLGLPPISVDRDNNPRGDDILVTFGDVMSTVRAVVVSTNKVCDVDGGFATFVSASHQRNAIAGGAAAAAGAGAAPVEGAEVAVSA